MQPSDEVETKIGELEKLALALIGQAMPSFWLGLVLVTAVTLRELLSLEAAGSLAAPADGRSPR